MRDVGFVSFVNFHEWSGGGEQCLRELHGAGVARGLSITSYSLWPEVSLPPLRDHDVWVTADLGNLPRLQRRARIFGKGLLPGTSWSRFDRVLHAALNGRYFHIDNAYVDICREPYLPCASSNILGKCPCAVRPTVDLYGQARGCFFVSPLHREVVGQYVQLDAAKAHILRPTFDPAPYLAARASVRDIENVFVGAVVPSKIGDLLERVRPLTVVSPYPTSVPSDVELLVGLRPLEVASILGRSRKFVYESRWPEPFGRVVAEAALAGCELDVRGPIGAMSFEEGLTDPALYIGSADEFWDRVLTEDPGCS